ncbi:hypothetical protein ADUPG1_000016 [Aduncisulcus paluster]|uniref:Uncharacterized protein n=1 Tax=Aduncisulcus paluster TaxID=2918883 RepID=A0ABQ5K489_9EUKA|nr:hypothetical protein ADUPG1_000016 [Aduncisulcus paluster]|eukprot:gnl/Carplike_NY0171/2192_a2952_662.p1 GENE.gnl/Carplike_NY0171/2192_a2952_662~~gnl/Carplike_NY0171/2192_a2952_662.p1  ORF type:complete len:176 (-),score=42.88 gnl/Carplike_NY0171/2192_a2952_662:202-729(-)
MKKVQRKLEDKWDVKTTESVVGMVSGDSPFLLVDNITPDGLDSSLLSVVPSMDVSGTNGTLNITFTAPRASKTVITLDTGDIDLYSLSTISDLTPQRSPAYGDRFVIICLGDDVHDIIATMPPGTSVKVIMWHLIEDNNSDTLSLFSYMPEFTTRYAKATVLSPIVYKKVVDYDV